MNQERKETQVLPLPGFYQPDKVTDWKWLVDWRQRFLDAQEWSKRFNLQSAATDRFKVALLMVDTMLTFCHPDFELYVAGRSGRGGLDDTVRTAEFIYRNLAYISEIVPTLDTHRAWQIFFATFVVDPFGHPPDPAKPLLVTLDDAKSGRWRVNTNAAQALFGDANRCQELQAHFVHVVEELEKTGRLTLTVWPFHSMLGSFGHALMPHLQEACFFHSIARSAQTRFEIKGLFPLTENYSVFGPEVAKNHKGKRVGRTNWRLLRRLLEFDVIILLGQAKSHCVRWSIEHLIHLLPKDVLRKIYVIEDCTSSIVVPDLVDFTDQTDAAFRLFEESGVHLVTSKTPIMDWPGIERAA